MKMIYWLLLTSLCATGLNASSTIPLAEEKATIEKFNELSKQSNSIVFQPPQGWLLGDSKGLAPCVKVMVVGKGKTEFPPSLNLVVQDFTGTLKQYLRIVKAICEHHGDEWKDLGVIQTQAGEASLSQADTQTKWGIERKMHVILLKEGQIAILTGAALKDDFCNHYKEFFDAFRSLRINTAPAKIESKFPLESKEPTEPKI